MRESHKGQENNRVCDGKHLLQKRHGCAGSRTQRSAEPGCRTAPAVLTVWQTPLHIDRVSRKPISVQEQRAELRYGVLKSSCTHMCK